MKCPLPFALAFLLFVGFTLGQSSNASLTVSGSASVFINVTIAEVELGVQVQARNASQAQAQAAVLAQNILNALQGFNVSKLQTTDISLSLITPTIHLPVSVSSSSSSSPSPSPSSSSSLPSGSYFQFSNVLTFNVPIAEAGQALDAAVSAGANTVNSVSFLANSSAESQAQLEATRLATANALSTGGVLLSALGCSAVGLGNVELSPNMITGISPLATTASIASSVVTPVEGGQQEVSASVQVTIIYSCPSSAISAINSNSAPSI